MYSEGIDVSLYQPDIRHLLPKPLVIVKISQDDFLDPLHEQHLAVSAGSDFRGGYHWLGMSDAGAQAKLYLRNCGDVDFHCLDVEGKYLANVDTKPLFLAKGRAFIAALHALDQRPVLLYSSRGTWPGNLGQDGNWVADYTGDPNRLFLRLTRQAVPWVIWQFTSKPLDRDYFRPEVLAKLCGRTAPAPTPVGGTKVKYIQISAADADALPTLALPLGVKIEDFEGTSWKTLPGATSVRAVPGLVDGHTNRHAVVIHTARFYKDGIARPTIQVAVLP